MHSIPDRGRRTLQAKMQMVNTSMVGIVGALDRALATNNLEKVPPDMTRRIHLPCLPGDQCAPVIRLVEWPAYICLFDCQAASAS